MQDGLHCKPEAARTCPKAKPNAPNQTRRKLPRCCESSSTILAMKRARCRPYTSQSGNAPNMSINTAFRYNSRPPYPTQQPSRSRSAHLSPAYDCPSLPIERVRGRPKSTAAQRSLRQYIASEPQHPPHRSGFRSPFKHILEFRHPRSRRLADRRRSPLRSSTGVSARRTTINDTLPEKPRLHLTR